MSLPEKQIKILELLAKIEATMSQLYKVCAQKFPELRGFWSSLSEEEQSHSDWIKKLSLTLQEGSLSFKEERFKAADIQTLLATVEDTVSKFQGQEISLTDALFITLYLEQSLMERKFFEVFATDARELRQTLIDLNDAVTEHRTKLVKALAERED